MSSKAVEHLVLFTVKPKTHPSKIDALISGLNALSSLPSVAYIAAAPISTNHSHPFNFTYVIHGRFNTTADLDSYIKHPAHRRFAKQFFLPIYDDYLIADWVTDIDGPIVPQPGSTARIMLLKLKEGGLEQDVEKGKKILTVLGGIRRSVPEINQISFGENFSKIGHKGFMVGSISFCFGPKASKALDSVVEMQKDNAGALLEHVVTTDYEIPQLASSKL